MKNSKVNYYFFPCKLCLLLLSLILFISNGDAVAQEKKNKKKVKHWEIRFGLATTYDNNILKYSDKYLDRFMNGQDPGRFHIETYDDLILNPSLELIYTFRIFKKLKTRINASYSSRIYAVNSIKDWYSSYIGLQQYLPGRASFKILYSYIPEFYVRHFRDPNWVRIHGYKPFVFQPFAFAKDNFGFYIQKYFFKNTRIKLSLYYARYFHNEHFTEYDSKDLLYGIKLYQPISKKLRLEFSYQYVTSDAKGYDASYQTPETTTGPDATYVEDRFSLGLLWRLPKLSKRSNNLTVRFDFLKRYYSSPYRALEDPLHAGRVDNNYRFFITYNINLYKALKLSLFYNWYMRDSDTKAKINSFYVSNEKDYNQSRIGLKLVYRLKF